MYRIKQDETSPHRKCGRWYLNKFIPDGLGKRTLRRHFFYFTPLESLSVVLYEFSTKVVPEKSLSNYLLSKMERYHLVPTFELRCLKKWGTTAIEILLHQNFFGRARSNRELHG
jgi:hypothetical protein